MKEISKVADAIAGVVRELAGSGYWARCHQDQLAVDLFKRMKESEGDSDPVPLLYKALDTMTYLVTESARAKIDSMVRYPVDIDFETRSSDNMRGQVVTVYRACLGIRFPKAVGAAIGLRDSGDEFVHHRLTFVLENIESELDFESDSFRERDSRALWALLGGFDSEAELIERFGSLNVGEIFDPVEQEVLAYQEKAFEFGRTLELLAAKSTELFNCTPASQEVTPAV